MTFKKFRKLFHGTLQNLKLITRYSVKRLKKAGKNLNLPFSLSLVNSFPEFYAQLLINWSTYFVSNATILHSVIFPAVQ